MKCMKNRDMIGNDNEKTSEMIKKRNHVRAMMISSLRKFIGSSD